MEANIHLLEDTTKTKAQRAEENKVKDFKFIFYYHIDFKYFTEI